MKTWETWLVVVFVTVELLGAAFLLWCVRAELSDPPDWFPVEVHIHTGGQRG